MATVIGIDLGTANSCVSFIKDGVPAIVVDSDGNKTMPSVFALSPTREAIVGHAAAEQAERNRQGTIFAVKRLIGRKYKSKEVMQAAEKLPYGIVPAENGDAWVQIGDEEYSPEQVSANILEKLKEIADEYLGEKTNQAVITVPAHFNDSQRQATKDAGLIAGLDVLRLINEPTAAALAYGLDLVDLGQKDSERTIAVFDLGGGTFDISILSLKSGIFDVLSTNGDTYLGGEDFDNAIMEYLIHEFERVSNANIRGDKDALERVKQAAKAAKHKLSEVSEVEVTLPFFRGMDDLKVALNRKTLEKVVSPILAKLDRPCKQALADAGLSPRDVSDVILVGGMTRMPAVKRRCEKIFGTKPLDSIDPDEAVARGAAIQAGLLEGAVKGVTLFDVTSLSLGLEVQGGQVQVLVPRNTTIPAKITETFTTSAPNQTQVSFHVVQGESSFAPDNKSLSRFELEHLKPAPRGEPNIEVSFEIDHEGIVSVFAKDTDSGEEQQVRIVASSGLSDSEIDMLLREQRIKEAQVSKRARREGGSDREADSGITADLDDIRKELRDLIYITQAHLSTDGKEFRGRARAQLEETLIRARAILESEAGDVQVAESLRELREKVEPLEKFLENAW